LPKNVYNINETSIILSILGFVKVLVSKYNRHDYRGARVKRTFVTIIKYISSDNRYLNLIIIWLANTYRSN
jgi:hypothetical protein